MLCKINKNAQIVYPYLSLVEKCLIVCWSLHVRCKGWFKSASVKEAQIHKKSNKFTKLYVSINSEETGEYDRCIPNYSVQFKSRFVSIMLLFLLAHFLWRRNDFFQRSFEGIVLGTCMPMFAWEARYRGVDRTLINRRLTWFPETSDRHIG